jgi:hypothetical protein
VTGFGGEPQNLDDDDKPPEGEPDAGPYKAWSSHTSTNPYYHGMQSVQLKTVGHTHKAACMKFYGSDPENPSKARLEITQHRKVLGSFDFTTKPELKFYIAGLTPNGGHLTGGTAGPAGRMSVCRASVASTPRSFGSRLPAW